MNAFIKHFEEGPKPFARGTLKEYRSGFKLFARFLDDTYDGAVFVDAFTTDMLEKFYAWLKVGLHGHERTAYTKQRLVNKVEALWAWLDEREDPRFRCVPRARTIDMEKQHDDPVDAPTWEEMALCIDACVSEGPRRLATILYYTGVRFEQAMDFDWSQVDVERGTMVIKPHKALAGRIIPMSPHFAAELAKWGTRKGRLTAWDAGESKQRERLWEAWERAAVRREVWDGSPAKAFRRGVTTGLKLAGINKEDAELYLGRTVEGARKSYLAVGMLPLEHVAQAIPAVGKSNVVAMKAKGEG